MAPKAYIKYFIGLVIAFLIFHGVTWNLVTNNIFENTEGKYIGDLGRFSYAINSLHPRANELTLSRASKTFVNHNKVDIITVGDSFSNGSVGGRNPFYQDFIATEKNLNVVNIQPSPKGFIETILILNSSGALDSMRPKAIILESVERSSIQRLSKPINWNIEGNLGELLDASPLRVLPQKIDMPFINHHNYKASIYPILYNYDDNALWSKAYKATLNDNYFTSKDGRTLLYYSGDLKNIKRANFENISLLNSNLNLLQEILKEKSIKLFFLPAADKYNIYSKYIVNNKQPESSFFELLRETDKSYYLIDTKMILRKLSDRGVHDIYYSDDTHWSNKASAAISKSLKL